MRGRIIIQCHALLQLASKFCLGGTNMLLPVVVSLCLLTIGRTAVLNPRNQFQQQPSNSWAVEIEGGKEKANEIAEKHGLVNLGQVCYCTLYS